MSGGMMMLRDWSQTLRGSDTGDHYQVEIEKTNYKPSRETIEKLEALAKIKRESKKQYKKYKHRRKK